jgi:hypothetical protein
VAARNDATNERLESLTGFALYPCSSVLVCPLCLLSEMRHGHERTGNKYIIKNVICHSGLFHLHGCVSIFLVVDLNFSGYISKCFYLTRSCYG